MNGLTTTIYRKSSKLPALDERNFFHSRALFEICEHSPRQKPYMVVVTDATGRVLSHLLAIMRIRTLILPPFLMIHCRVLGEGVYAESDYTREELFGLMIQKLTAQLNKLTIYIEVSNLSQKMFGYRQLRQLKFFPVHWMSIHNSLHSRQPEERISEKMQRRIDNAHSRGAVTTEVETEEDFKAFSKLLRRHHILKPKRYIPDDVFFRQTIESGNGKLFVTKYKKRIIGCTACVFSEGDAYLWYSAFRRKTFLPLHPDTIAVWDTIKYAYGKSYQHMRFMDVGLPFRNNPFREFILRFGGKEVSTLRWFRFSIKWVNRLLAWIYRD